MFASDGEQKRKTNYDDHVCGKSELHNCQGKSATVSSLKSDFYVPVHCCYETQYTIEPLSCATFHELRKTTLFSAVLF